MHRQRLVGGDCTPRRAAGQMSGAVLRERFARRYGIESRMADILQRAVRGESNDEISRGTGLARRTVKNKIIQLYRIVGVINRGATSRAELVARCTAEVTPVTTTSMLL
jgi:DNA-binding CsgD family transcriptional regulator